MQVKCDKAIDECVENKCVHSAGHIHHSACADEACLEKGIRVSCLPFVENNNPIHQRDLESEVTVLTERVDRLQQALLVADDMIAALDARQRAVAAPRSFYEECAINAMNALLKRHDGTYCAKDAFIIADEMEAQMKPRRS